MCAFRGATEDTDRDPSAAFDSAFLACQALTARPSRQEIIFLTSRASLLGLATMTPPLRLTREFLAAIKLADAPAYRLAAEVGMAPAMLSRIMRGADVVPAGTPKHQKLLQLGRLLRVPARACFEAAHPLKPAGEAGNGPRASSEAFGRATRSPAGRVGPRRPRDAQGAVR